MNKKKNLYDQAILQCRGILHIGAHYGQEREVYSQKNKDVCWIEGDPDVFKILEHNIFHYKNHTALNFLLSDVDNKEYIFKISSNEGQSSSIFEMDSWHIDKGFSQPTSVSLLSSTLATLIEKEKLKINKYNYWVIDVQGAELLVLKGSKGYFKKYCKFLKIEISQTPTYKCGVLFNELNEFLEFSGFKLLSSIPNEHGDVLYINKKI